MLNERDYASSSFFVLQPLRAEYENCDVQHSPIDKIAIVRMQTEFFKVRKGKGSDGLEMWVTSRGSIFFPLQILLSGL